MARKAGRNGELLDRKQLCLIAIRPSQSCNAEFLKVLVPGEIYYFNRDYEINSPSPNNESIRHLKTLPDGLFDVDGISINISAIVGKNGAGKSTLVELLYAGLYNLSLALGIIEKVDEDGKEYKRLDHVDFDLYIRIDNRLGRFTFLDSAFFMYWANELTGRLDNPESIRLPEQLETLFYTISVNYSLYGLNTEEIGHWLKAIFHKNDGYQTPIVITPFRKKGNIDINRENDLVRTRLLSNIIEDSEALHRSKPLINGKIPKRLYFSVDGRKFGAEERKMKVNKLPKYSTWELEVYGSLILPEVFDVFFGNRNYIPEDNLLNRFARQYVVRKIITIAGRYKPYKKLYKELADTFLASVDSLKGKSFDVRTERIDVDMLKSFLKDLVDDTSHITLKLKQTLSFIWFDFVPKDKLEFDLPVSDLAKAIDRKIRNAKMPKFLEDERSIIQFLVPPSFLWYNIEFEQTTKRFDSLSSGEKQRIYSFASLAYHLRNLDSIHGRNEKATLDIERLNEYGRVNIVFDEIELYFHPEFQRTFVLDLLKTIENSTLKNIGAINIVFITHSPFILSDIPSKGVMYLEEVNGRSIQRKEYLNSFGGNIHEILASNFFFETGYTLGAFVKGRIQETLDWCNNPDIPYAKSPEYYQQLVDIIDEPVMKMKLREMVAKKLGRSVEVARLRAQQQYIQEQLKMLTNDSN